MGFEITPKDIELLTLINRCGAVTNEQAKMIYGAETKLYLKRLVRLSTNHIVSRSGGYVEITEKGSGILNQEKRVRIKKWERPYRAAMAQLIFDLPDWEIEFGTEIKRRIEINRGSKIAAVIRKGGIRYGIYQLLYDDPDQDRIGFVWKDLQELPQDNGCPDRAVIIYRSDTAIKTMFEKVKACEPTMNEILLVHSNTSLTLLDRYHGTEFTSLLLQRFPGLTHSHRKLAQYKYKDDYVCVQAFHDAVAMKYLHNYYNGFGHKSEGRLVNIVCTDNTSKYLRELFPHAKFHIISDDLTRFKPVPRTILRPSLLTATKQ
ncbi:hypothetical protein ACOBQJ_03390 [Pelotomaculum propionicicum]|uniref:hypothetical protein n=1 Tax=Pelotomaculum propionicicum TaxID=258475 RepID=UPI003B77E18B